MWPVIWKVPGLGLEIPGYGLALMIGFLLSIMWAARRAERSGANPDVVLNCGFLALLGGIVGSRVMYVWHYWDQYARYTSNAQLIWAIVDVRKGGLEVYGGFICVVLLVFVYLWRGRHSIRWYLDIMAPSAALGMAIGRLGCFLNGCCWGGVCDLPWAVQFPYGSGASRQQWTDRVPGAALPQELLIFAPRGIYADGEAAVPVARESLRVTDQELDRDVAAARDHAKRLRDEAEHAPDPKRRERLLAEAARAELGSGENYDIRVAMQRYGVTAAELRAIAARHPSLPVHPTQLYSAITLGLLAALLAALYWRRTRDGQVILTLLLIEPWTRWMLERLRADNPADVGGFTISQAIALGISLVGLLGLIGLRTQPARSPRAKLWEPPAEQQSAVPKRASQQ